MRMPAHTTRLSLETGTGVTSGLGSDLTSLASFRRAEKQLANLLQSDDPEGLPGQGVRDTVTGSPSG